MKNDDLSYRYYFYATPYDIGWEIENEMIESSQPVYGLKYCGNNYNFRALKYNANNYINFNIREDDGYTEEYYKKVIESVKECLISERIENYRILANQILFARKIYDRMPLEMRNFDALICELILNNTNIVFNHFIEDVQMTRYEVLDRFHVKGSEDFLIKIILIALAYEIKEQPASFPVDKCKITYIRLEEETERHVRLLSEVLFLMRYFEYTDSMIKYESYMMKYLHQEYSSQSLIFENVLYKNGEALFIDNQFEIERGPVETK